MMMMSLRLSAAPDSTRCLAVGAMERVVDSVGVAAVAAVSAALVVSAAVVVSVEAVVVLAAVVSAAAMVGEEAVAVGVPEEDLAVVSAAAVVTGEAEDLEGVIKCRTDLFLSVDCFVLYVFCFS